MEYTENTIVELIEAWKTLYKETKYSKKLKFDAFEAVFSQTYLLLAECSKGESIDKRYIRLIAEAFKFASINDSSLENECLAATVLTERMLNSVAFNISSEVSETAVIYVLESHEEITLAFNDVNDSISKLAKVYSNAGWKQN